MRSEPRSARTPVWALSGSLAATSEITFVFFSSGYLDVSVHRVPFHALWIGAWIRKVFLRGFPHSDICGSSDICSFPQLFAAYRVFLRLSVPRHPPCALYSLTIFRSDLLVPGLLSCRALPDRLFVSLYFSDGASSGTSPWVPTVLFLYEVRLV